MLKYILCILLIVIVFSGTDLYVGYAGKNNNFNTVQEAINKAASIGPKDESTRVTIHIAPGTYRQQVMVQTPYITFVNDEPSKGEVLLTWYYGIGYKYYSANDNGVYDANAAKAKSAKRPAKQRWGATVLLTNKASNFKAKDITFENSFNRYMTNEELADGVEVLGDSNTSPINVQRTSSLDVKSKAATERGAALAADCGYAEFLNCRFYSSQDTLYTGGSPLYFKKCLIEGQTDYIFGESNVVFDSCELRWKGYSSGSVGGYITAARGEGSYTGMLMYNCKVTKNKSLTVTKGYFGRPWRDTAKVKFINTVLEDDNTIAAEGWGSMSGVQPENVAGFKEYGTKLANGQAVNTSQRKGHILSQADAEKTNIISYLNNWTPSFM
jgi:pectin methylesterase-like acyl-CoA thioesterase